MLDFDIFAINVTIDERRRVDKEWFLSFEDAYANRMKYRNWFADKGDVYIVRYAHGDPHEVEMWSINEKGDVIGHYISG